MRASHTDHLYLDRPDITLRNHHCAVAELASNGPIEEKANADHLLHGGMMLADGRSGGENLARDLLAQLDAAPIGESSIRGSPRGDGRRGSGSLDGGRAATTGHDLPYFPDSEVKRGVVGDFDSRYTPAQGDDSAQSLPRHQYPKSPSPRTRWRFLFLGGNLPCLLNRRQELRQDRPDAVPDHR